MRCNGPDTYCHLVPSLYWDTVWTALVAFSYVIMLWREHAQHTYTYEACRSQPAVSHFAALSIPISLVSAAFCCLTACLDMCVALCYAVLCCQVAASVEAQLAAARANLAALTAERTKKEQEAATLQAKYNELLAIRWAELQYC